MTFYLDSQAPNAHGLRGTQMVKHLRRLGGGLVAFYHLLADAPQRTPAQEAWTPPVKRR